MLTKCPECELQISDKAISCPHCGYPIKEISIKRARHKPNKRRRLPNGFGQISELKGRNLRKPFRAMVTTGKTDEGKPICKLLCPEAYFKTYNEAYQALLEYNKNPFMFMKNITMLELYEQWMKSYEKEVSGASVTSAKTAWRYCKCIENIKVIEIRSRHIRYCIDEGKVIKNGKEVSSSPGMKAKIKSLLNQLFDYAVEYEYTDKNYARITSLSKSNQKEIEENRESHNPYTEEEISFLWNNVSKPGADVILIQCYTGLRPKELELLLIKDIDLNEKKMKGGVKTDAGKNRIIPIHSKIFELVKKRYEESVSLESKYLITYTGNGVHNKTTNELPYTYRRFHTDMKNIMPNHKPHDGRAHFITEAKKYNVDEYAIKKIVGHKIKDVTEHIYTKRDFEWLKTEIEKIK